MIFHPLVVISIILILATAALGVMVYVKRSATLSGKCNSDSNRIWDDSMGNHLTFRQIAIDLLNAILIELFWVLTGVGISGYLAVNFLNPIFGGWAFLVPIIIFGLLTLLFTACLNPKWYILLLICAIDFLLFPYLQDLLSDGFYVWEMTYTGGWMDFGRIVQLFFWNGTFVCEAISLAVGKCIRLMSAKDAQN